jgi:hypothetical protein
MRWPCGDNELCDCIIIEINRCVQLRYRLDCSSLSDWASIVLNRCFSNAQSVSDRYYRALYSKLFASELLGGIHSASGMQSRQALLLNLLWRSMKADTDVARMTAFAKRLLQVLIIFAFVQCFI